MHIEIFPWNDNFKTGIDIIDEQHHKLVEILNRLAMDVALNADAMQLNKIFEELLEYTIYHFKTEEEIWDEYFKDDLLSSEHHKIHSDFTSMALQFKAKESEGLKREIAQELLLNLTKWLATHILETDRYMAYIVLALKNGLSFEDAKEEAAKEMEGLSKTLIEVVLSIYSALSSKTMELLHEMKKHDVVAQENENLLYYDRLTNLPNRQKIMLDMSKRAPHACVIFNINRFQELNDSFGVEAGDSILVQIAEGVSRLGVIPYRIGGDEFAILIYDKLSKNELTEWVYEKFAQINELQIIVNHEVVKIIMSVGAALHTEKLLTHADIALHQAKERKEAFRIYEKDDKVEELYRQNIEMTEKIHKALLEDRVVCHYQAIVTLDTNTTQKYETLVRMLDEDGTIISPMAFLPIAKKTKLYPRITRTVVHKACECFKNRDEVFSVNLSIDDINDPFTVQEVIKTIIMTDTANRIVFEILESEDIDNYDSVAQFIKQVKALGARIAIDDFGSGYSNFEHVLQLNVDFIKIDGSLIKGIASNQRHHIIVETIVDFAKKMGAKTIAEYVCDEDVYSVVKSLGVDYSQGYFTGKPSPLE